MNKEFGSLNGTIVIPPNNQMTGTFDLIRVGDSGLNATLRIGHESTLDSTLYVRAKGDAGLDSKIRVVFPEESDLLATIQPRAHSHLQGKIEVPVHNRMVGAFEVTEPPRQLGVFNPIKDTFVRSDAPALSYGQETVMQAGHNDTDEADYWSLIQFDWQEEIADYMKIDSANIRLYYSNNPDDIPQLKVETVGEPWAEGTTWYGRPIVGESLVEQYSINEEQQYIEFNVLPLIQEMHQSGREINGFYIRNINPSENKDVSFDTRESSRPPELRMEYYNPIPFSDGFYNVVSRIKVVYPENNDLQGTLNIHSDFGFSKLDSTLYVLRQKIREGKIIVNRGILAGTLSVKRGNDKSIDGTVTVKQDDSSKRDGVIRVNKGSLASKLYVKALGSNDLQGTIRPKAKGYEKLNATANINKYFIFGTIGIIGYGDKDLDSRVAVMREDDKPLDATLGITKKNIPGNIIVKAKDERDLNATIHIRQDDEKDTDATISVNRYLLNGSIYVLYRKDLVGSITIKGEDDKGIDGSLFLRYRDDIKGTVDVIGASHLEGSLLVRSPYLKATLRIPSYDEDDLEGTLISKVRWANDLNGTIVVGGTNRSGGYYYII